MLVQIKPSIIISALKMAGQFEKMVRCGKCMGFLPYNLDRVHCIIEKLVIIADCKKHVPEIRVLKPKKA